MVLTAGASMSRDGTDEMRLTALVLRSHGIMTRSFSSDGMGDDDGDNDDRAS